MKHFMLTREAKRNNSFVRNVTLKFIQLHLTKMFCSVHQFCNLHEEYLEHRNVSILKVSNLKMFTLKHFSVSFWFFRILSTLKLEYSEFEIVQFKQFFNLKGLDSNCSNFTVWKWNSFIFLLLNISYFSWWQFFLEIWIFTPEN